MYDLGKSRIMWHIDHIIPLKYRLQDENLTLEQIIEQLLNHYGQLIISVKEIDLLSTKKSTRKKKYIVVFKNGTISHFGNIKYPDYTITNDNERKRFEKLLLSTCFIYVNLHK